MCGSMEPFEPPVSAPDKVEMELQGLSCTIIDHGPDTKLPTLEQRQKKL